MQTLEYSTRVLKYPLSSNQLEKRNCSSSSQSCHEFHPLSIPLIFISQISFDLFWNFDLLFMLKAWFSKTPIIMTYFNGEGQVLSKPRVFVCWMRKRIKKLLYWCSYKATWPVHWKLMELSIVLLVGTFWQTK